MSNPLPLNGDRLTNHLRRALSGSGHRQGLKVAQEIPDDSTLEYLDDRPANVVLKALREFN